MRTLSATRPATPARWSPGENLPPSLDPGLALTFPFRDPPRRPRRRDGLVPLLPQLGDDGHTVGHAVTNAGQGALIRRLRLSRRLSIGGIHDCLRSRPRFIRRIINGLQLGYPTADHWKDELGDMPFSSQLVAESNQILGQLPCLAAERPAAGDVFSRPVPLVQVGIDSNGQI